MTSELLTEEVTDLVKVEGFNAVAVFTGGGMNAVLSKIEETVRAIPLDPSTISGRDQIRSVAYKVARTKTTLDAEGKRLTEEWRKNTTLVNAERKKATERLDALAEEVRKPLTEFENKEQNRVAAHEACLAEMAGVLAMLQNSPDMDVALLQEHLLDFSELHKDRDWEEFASRAALTRRDVSLTLISRIEARKKHEAEQAELARLRQEEAVRQQRERDEAIARTAAENARIKAERQAQEAAGAIEAAREAERERAAAEAEMFRKESERHRREAEEKRAAEERARVKAEREKTDAERRAKEADDARIAFAHATALREKDLQNQAAADLKEAQEKAKREQAAALQRQRDRIEREKKIAEDARLKREADEENQARIHGEIIADLARFDGIDTATAIANAIMAGNIRNVKVVF